MQPQGHREDLSPRMFPQPVSRLNRRVIGVIVLIIAALVMLALRMSARPGNTREAAEHVPDHSTSTPKPEGMLRLPASYADIPPVTPRGGNGSPAAHEGEPLQVQAAEDDPVRAGRQPCVQNLTDAREAGLLVNIRTPRGQNADSTQGPTRRSSSEAGAGGAQAALSSLRQESLIALTRNAAGNLTKGEERGDPRHAFLEHAQQPSAIYVQDRIQEPMSPYTVHAGTIIPASLITGINSDLPGTLIAQVREAVYDSVTGNHLLIPQGTRLLGVYDANVVFGHKRVLMAWQRMIFPNGTSIQLEGMPGVDLAGLAGIKDTVNFHLWPLFRSVLLSTVLSVGSRLPAGNVGGEGGASPIDEFAQQGAQNINAAGQRIVDRELGRQPTLEIRPGFSLAVMVHRDMILRPYEGS